MDKEVAYIIPLDYDFPELPDSFTIGSVEDLEKYIPDSMMTGYRKLVTQGSSISLAEIQSNPGDFQHWIVLSKIERTKGLLDLVGKTRIPILTSPLNGSLVYTHPHRKAGTLFECLGYDPYLKYQFVFFRDSLYEDTVVLSEFTPENFYRFKIEDEPIYPGSVYWKVRLKFADGTIGSWSKLRELKGNKQERWFDDDGNVIDKNGNILHSGFK